VIRQQHRFTVEKRRRRGAGASKPPLQPNPKIQPICKQAAPARGLAAEISSMLRRGPLRFPRALFDVASS
jgi:hypothetical protein